MAKKDKLLREVVYIGCKETDPDIAYISYNNKAIEVNPKSYGDRKLYFFSELYKYEYVENSNPVTKGGFGLGRSIAGGTLFGPVGAVTGAATKTLVNEMKIVLTFRDTITGEFVQYELFYDATTITGFAIKKDSKKYSKQYELVMRDLSILEEVYRLGHPEENDDKKIIR